MTQQRELKLWKCWSASLTFGLKGQFWGTFTILLYMQFSVEIGKKYVESSYLMNVEAPIEPFWNQ